MTSTVLPWYVLMVRPRHEKAVARSLAFKGYSEFLPLYQKRARSGRHTRSSELPLFPMYVFCRFDPAVRLPVLMIPGVLSVISVAGIPAPVDDSEVDSIRTLVQSGMPLTPHPYPELQVGETVEVVSGPLLGIQGILTGFRGKYRLVLSISLLKHSAAVEIGWDEVRLLTPHYLPSRQTFLPIAAAG